MNKRRQWQGWSTVIRNSFQSSISFLKLIKNRRAIARGRRAAKRDYYFRQSYRSEMERLGATHFAMPRRTPSYKRNKFRRRRFYRRR